jgi:hypothetical protein
MIELTIRVDGVNQLLNCGIVDEDIE